MNANPTIGFESSLFESSAHESDTRNGRRRFARSSMRFEVVPSSRAILSSGGAFGSGTWASPAGTGAISAGINAGSQYYQNGTINPVDVGASFVAGTAGAYFPTLAWNVAINAAGGGVGTGINNVVYGKNDSVSASAFTSGLLSSLGYGLGKTGESAYNVIAKPGINSPSWVAPGSWTASGWNLFRPNATGVVLGTVAGGMGGEVAGAAVQNLPNLKGQK